MFCSGLFLRFASASTKNSTFIFILFLSLPPGASVTVLVFVAAARCISYSTTRHGLMFLDHLPQWFAYLTSLVFAQAMVADQMTAGSAVRHWTGILLLATGNMSDQPFPITAIGRHRTLILFKRARACVADPKENVLPASEPAIRIHQKITENFNPSSIRFWRKEHGPIKKVAWY